MGSVRRRKTFRRVPDGLCVGPRLALVVIVCLSPLLLTIHKFSKIRDVRGIECCGQVIGNTFRSLDRSGMGNADGPRASGWPCPDVP